MEKNPTKYFERKYVNFDIIYHECRDNALEGSYKNYQTVSNNNSKNYPEKEKKETVKGLIRNYNRKDLFIEKKVINNYFKT